MRFAQRHPVTTRLGIIALLVSAATAAWPISIGARADRDFVSELEQLLAVPFDRSTNTFDGCGPQGGATNAEKAASNRLKNRFQAPEDADIDPTVTLAALSKPGNDRDRFSPNRAAEIIGYIRDVGPGGISSGESCNCKERRALLADTHFDITPDRTHVADRNVVVVEVTPRVRWLMAKQGVDWRTSALKQAFRFKKVRIRGWLLFDTDHLQESWNLDPKNRVGRKNWRRTCWEIHPVTSIEVVE